jgi:15-cis-phytoene synthase
MMAPPAEAGGSRTDLPAELRRALTAAAAVGSAEGLPSPELQGQLIRPTVAVAGVLGGSPSPPADGFWRAALAIQLAHEASLLHDDVIDAADRRRGHPTAVAEGGVAQALVQGDHLLAAAYWHAISTGSVAFALRFARAVERTIAGEIEQGRSTGRRLDLASYRTIVVAKSGELLGVALSADAALRESAAADPLQELGRRTGLAYQMVDDLLDYCPLTDTGKPPLADHRQRKWTWVLAFLPPDAFDDPTESVLDALRTPVDGVTPLRLCLDRLTAEVAELEADVLAALPQDRILRHLLRSWLERAGEAVAREEASLGRGRPRQPSSALTALIPSLDEVGGYIHRRSRSFHFATAFFPAADRQRISRVYTFCRVTDDIVDARPEVDPADREALLDEWLALAAYAYAGHASGVPLLDRVMAEMAAGAVPFEYARELCEGVRMDLHTTRYASLGELRGYTYRVASVVGLWIARLGGIHDAATLTRAAALGHAMQLTNILRDVGEDLAMGRVYLPADWLDRHGLSEGDLHAIRSRGEPVPRSYRALVERLMGVADRDYASAIESIPALLPAFRMPVAIAARLYGGIHEEIRRNEYDNLTRRAHTTTLTKVKLALGAVPRGRSKLRAYWPTAVRLASRR